MALDVTTIDCTALDEGDLAEMADLCADNAAGYDLETLTKVRDEWVLITRVRETDSEKLRAFSMPMDSMHALKRLQGVAGHRPSA